MAKFLFYFILISFTSTHFTLNAQQNWNFVKQFGSPWGSATDQQEQITGIETDDSGNVYLTGITRGQMIVENDTFWANPDKNIGFAAKFNCVGDLEWYQSMVRIPWGIERSNTTGDFFIATSNSILRLKPNGDTTLLFESQDHPIQHFTVNQEDNIYVFAHVMSSFQTNDYAPGHSFQPNSSFIAIHDSSGSVINFVKVLESNHPSRPVNPYYTTFKSNSLNELYLAGAISNYGYLWTPSGDTVNPPSPADSVYTAILKFDSLANYVSKIQFEGYTDFRGFTINENDDLVFTGAFESYDSNSYERRQSIGHLNKLIIMSGRQKVIDYDNFGFLPDSTDSNYNNFGRPWSIDTYQDRVGASFLFSEEEPFQYGTTVLNSNPNSPIIRAPGFIEFKADSLDSYNHDYLHIETTGINRNKIGRILVKYDHEGNLFLAGQVYDSIFWRGNKLPLSGGPVDLFIARYGNAGCDAHAARCDFVPYNFKLDSITPHTAILSWESAGYDSLWNIEYGISGFTHGSGTLLTGLTQNSVTLDSLQPGTAYTVYVRDSCSGNENGPWSDSLTFTTPYPPCPAPQNLTATNITDKSAQLTWHQVPKALEYIIEWGESGFSLGSGDTAVTQDTSLQLNSLNPDTEYDAYITSHCLGDSTSQAYGPQSFASLPDTGLPDTTINYIQTANSETEFRLYPNPARNVLNLEYKQVEEVEILVFSVSGQLFYSQKGLNGEGHREINTARWPAGMYIVHFKTIDENTQKIKVAVMK